MSNTIAREISKLPHVKGIFDDGVTDEPTQHIRATQEDAEEAVRTLLSFSCDDPTREGLQDTPKRVAKAYREFFKGYDESPAEILSKVFEEVADYDDMVLVRDIPFYSHCEHHMVPFFGTASIAYYPNAKGGVVGLSKLARLVECFARRLQTQETMTAQISDAINEHLKPEGVAVYIRAEHMCMSMRGIQKCGSSTVTRRFIGKFREDAEKRDFLAAVTGS